MTDVGAPVDVEPEIRITRSEASGGRCEVLDAHTARCTFAFGLSFFAPGFSAFLGDVADGLEVDGGAPDVGTRLDGGAAADRLVGGIGPDVFVGGTAGDALDGGRGVDELSFAARRAAVRLDVRAERFTSIERYVGGDGGDRLTGTGAPETFLGGPGDDRLNGAGGNDSLVDGLGDDVLDGGPGDDELRSQFGEDDGYPEYAETEAGGDDRLIGGAGDDVLTTSSGTDRLYGGLGDDRLSIDDYNALSGRGARLSGGAGDDRLGGGGTPMDLLLGGAGDDQLVSRDSFRGGASTAARGATGSSPTVATRFADVSRGAIVRGVDHTYEDRGTLLLRLSRDHSS